MNAAAALAVRRSNNASPGGSRFASGYLRSPKAGAVPAAPAGTNGGAARRHSAVSPAAPQVFDQDTALKSRPDATLALPVIAGLPGERISHRLAMREPHRRCGGLSKLPD